MVKDIKHHRKIDCHVPARRTATWTHRDPSREFFMFSPSTRVDVGENLDGSNRPFSGRIEIGKGNILTMTWLPYHPGFPRCCWYFIPPNANSYT